MTNPFVNVIIVTYNRLDYLQNCLESVQRQTYRNFDITVVDNNSTDGTIQFLQQYRGIRTIFLDRNIGCPGARNIGIINTKGDLLFFVDDDGSLEPDVIEIIVNEFVNEPELGAVVASIDENGKWLIRPYESEQKKRIYLPEFQGQGAINRIIFDKLGLYPTQFIYGAEESDLAFRMLDNKFRIVFQPNAITHHYRINLSRNPKQNIEKAKNHFLVVLKYIPFPLVIAWASKRFIVLLLSGFKIGRFVSLFEYLFLLPGEVVRVIKKRKFTVVSQNTIILREVLFENSIINYSSIPVGSKEHISLFHFQMNKIKKIFTKK